MNSLRIDTGEVEVLLNDGPESIKFNPTEINWARKYEKTRLEVNQRMNELSSKIVEFENKYKNAKDNDPNAIEELSNLRTDFCVYACEKIDTLFGEGTSKKAFGDLMSEVAIMSLFQGMARYITKGREPVISQYMPKEHKKHKVM